MARNFTDLEKEYGSGPDIPNDILYNFMEEIREQLVELYSDNIYQVSESSMGQEIRRRCKADLMWLAAFFTWGTNPEGVGRPISENRIDEEHYRCVIDLFVKKDDSKRIPDLSPVKTRLLLWPRTGMKSTIDHVDTVQWILNYPSIRILYLTAEAGLAEGFVGEVKGHFLIKEDPSWMQIFFPEFCLEEKDAGAKYTFTCPVFAAKKTKRKEPTVTASSVGKHKSGRHYEIIKADDAVSDKNTITSEQCETISKQLFLAEKLLALGGYYIDYIGTRYADGDHYGVLLEQSMIGEIVTKSGQGWTLTENKTTGVSILIGKAIQIKPEVAERLQKEERPVTYHEAGEDGCILLLPHIMPFNWLMADLAKDERSFEGQRNQNPQVASEVEFTRNLLLKNTIPYAEIPETGVITNVWDFAFSKKKGSDYSTGCSIMWAQNKNREVVGYVLRVVRDRFNHQTLAKAVVDLAMERPPYIIGVENAAGSRFLEPSINYVAAKTGDQRIIQTCAHIDWFPVDNQNQAKKTRMRALYPWLLRGGLKFANYCMSPDLNTLYSEFEKCLTTHHHDDIPDVISQQYRLYAPKAFQAITVGGPEVLSSRDSWNLLFEENCDPFGRMGYGPPTPSLQDLFVADPEMKAESYNGLPNYLGAGNWG